MKTFLKTMLALTLTVTFLLTGCETPDVSSENSLDINNTSSEALSATVQAECEEILSVFSGNMLLNRSFKSTDKISVRNLVDWYGYHLKALGTDLSPYINEDFGGLVFPAKEFETVIRDFFGLEKEHLQNSDSFYTEFDGYPVDGPLFELAENSYQITDAEVLGNTYTIYFDFTVEDNDTEKCMLVAEKNGDKIKFVSYSRRIDFANDEILNYEKLSIKTDYKLSHINSSLFTDDALYFTCYTSPYKDRNPDDMDYHNGRRRIIKMDFSGKSAQLPDFDDTLYEFVSILLEDENKNLYVKNIVTLVDEVGNEAGHEYTVFKLDQNGAAIEKTDLSEKDSFVNLCVDKDGYIYTQTSDTVSIFDPNLNKISDIDLNCHHSYDIFSVTDSRVVCVVEKDYTLRILTVDRENATAEESFVTRNMNMAYKGNSKYDILLHDYTEDKIYGVRLGETPKELVCLADYGLENFEITNLKLTESGDIVMVCDTGYEWPDGEKSKGGVSDVFILKKQ